MCVSYFMWLRGFARLWDVRLGEMHITLLLCIKFLVGEKIIRNINLARVLIPVGKFASWKLWQIVWQIIEYFSSPYKL